MTIQAQGEYRIDTFLSDAFVERRTRYEPAESSTLTGRFRTLTTTLETHEGPLSIDIRGEEPTWVYPALHGLQQIAKLEENWDSYGARPIRSGAIIMAVSILNQIMRDQSPAPCIVPSVDGGVGLEWHQSGIDFDIKVGATGLVATSYLEAGQAQTPHHEGPPDFARFADIISRL